MKEHSSEFKIIRMCKVLKVSRSAYYLWKEKPESGREKENKKLEVQIAMIQEKHKYRYGSPRVHKELKAQNIPCGIHRVAKIMKLKGLNAKTKRKYKATTYSKHKLPVAANLIQQDFTAKKENEKWSSDISYIRTLEGWVYLCVVLDLYSRKVVGWSLAEHMRTELVEEAYLMAYWRRKPKNGLIFHSDRGVQYASKRFQNSLKKHGATSSMSRKGNCYDNAVTETFFKTLKSELVEEEKYKTREEAKESIVEYVEIYYNTKRRHSYLNYMTPKEFEKDSKTA